MVKSCAFKRIVSSSTSRCTNYRNCNRLAFCSTGFLFVPLSGSKFKGVEFILEATLKGASAIILESSYFQATVPVIVVDNSFKELLRLLKIFYGDPCENLVLTGVTGTDGKTTTCAIINHLLNGRFNSALIGTNGIIYNEKLTQTFYHTAPFGIVPSFK